MQKHVNLVDLVKSFPTNILLQNLASIQKRTSPIKFAHLAEKSEEGSISNFSTKVVLETALDVTAGSEAEGKEKKEEEKKEEKAMKKLSKEQYADIVKQIAEKTNGGTETLTREEIMEIAESVRAKAKENAA